MSNQKWNAKLYDNNHQFVSEYGHDLIELLSPKEDERILDLGCGTGDLACEIKKTGAEVIGVDASEEMIKAAMVKHRDIEFQVMDATKLNFTRPFKSVFSNAVLHWIKTPQKVLKEVYNLLDENGRFVCEFGGKDNCKIILESVIKHMKAMNYDYDEENFPWYFPSIGEYTSLMEKEGFHVTYAVHFERPTKLMDEELGLKKWIDMFVGNLIKDVNKEDQDKLIVAVEKDLKETLFKDGHWYADYKRIRVIGVK